jgi:hypothetical protein
LPILPDHDNYSGFLACFTICTLPLSLLINHGLIFLSKSLFQSMTGGLATGKLSEARIVSELRGILKKEPFLRMQAANCFNARLLTNYRNNPAHLAGLAIIL